ncbi:MAG: DUF4962 domain-containing protein, partial [Epibacterium sp.]|nr:DUF4962 domain-containing protein [Epibacterium sp.]NQX75623.1 heparinase [Epibacterium sp.]
MNSRKKLVQQVCLWIMVIMMNGVLHAVDVPAGLAQASPKHPFLLANAQQMLEVQQAIAADQRLAVAKDHVIDVATALAEVPQLERKVVGRRLLSTSRACLKRVLYAGLAWRLTGDEKHLSTAKRAMLAAAQFSDWNPSHFLDVAEMTTALGIGYDWLYDQLSKEERHLIRNAIIDKGLKVGLGPNPKGNPTWLNSRHNWNQVCNGGLAIGALAVRDSDPEWAATLVPRAIENIPIVMGVYAPDGAYPEGPGYWSYGTTYNVLLIEALRGALGSDGGLSSLPGFAASGAFIRHAHGPTGQRFNYGDCKAGVGGLEPALFWFAREYGQPILIERQLGHLATFLAAYDKPANHSGRFTPLLLLWAAHAESADAATATTWSGKGTNSVAFHRSDWSPTAVYLALKGGGPGINHGHMDAGQFIIEAAGERWA